MSGQGEIDRATPWALLRAGCWEGKVYSVSATKLGNLLSQGSGGWGGATLFKTTMVVREDLLLRHPN